MVGLHLATRLTGFFVALTLLAWGATSAGFRGPEGALSPSFCVPLALAAAALLAGFTAGTPWQGPALWLALGLIGQMSLLRMIDAGRLMHYQHYRLERAHPALLAVLALQTVLVALGLRRHGGEVAAWVRLRFRWWQVLGIALLSLLFSATVSPDVKVYAAELAFAGFAQALNFATILLAAAAAPPSVLKRLERRFEEWFGPLSPERPEPGGPDRFALGAALYVTALAAGLSYFVYEGHPHIPDELGYFYHARYLAAGMLTMPAPPVPEAFDIDLMNYEEHRWFSPLPPGWPAMLAVGVRLGAPWLVNPVLAGINILLAYGLLRELYSRRLARLGVLLLCLSPWYVFMAMNLMNHTWTFTCILVGSWAVNRAVRGGRFGYGLVAGAATGVTSLIRPLDGLILAAFLGAWLVGLGGRRAKLPALGAFAVGVALLGGLALPYNRVLTGDPMRIPLMAYFDKYHGPKSNDMGFGPERGWGWGIDPNPGHSPLDAAINTNLNAFSTNIELFGWSTGSLILIAIALFSGALTRKDYLWVALVGAVVSGYSLYWFSGGPDFGARYWYLILPACIVLTCRGLQYIESRMSFGSPRVLGAAAALSLMAAVNYFPWRVLDKYPKYLEMRPDIRNLAREHTFGRSLILIQGERFPDYASAAIYNPLDFNAHAPVYAWDRSPEVRARLLERYKDRPLWIVEGPSRTRAGYRVVSVPRE
jgi:Dolichyl-phosphate-mannose-protein mannosyltransferase